MSDYPTILLIGLRGSGKSTLGRMLAATLGVGFLDLDTLTLKAMGFNTVAEAWETDGEAAFRKAEVASLSQVIGGGGVVALGGGTPMSPGAEQLISGSGALSIYLRGEPALLRTRLTGGVGADRPSLTGADPLDEIERVFHARDSRYRVLTDHVVELSAQEKPDETLSRLVGMIV